MKAQIEIVTDQYVPNHIMAIVDMSNSAGTMSVTNDAEAVVSYLHAKAGLGGRRLIYRDTMDQWDELLHDGNGRFLGFRHLGGDCLEQAIMLAGPPR